MRRLRVLRELLSLPAAVAVALLAVLGNLNLIAALFPQLRGLIDGLTKIEWIAQALAWLAQSGLPNWLGLILIVLAAAAFEGAFRKLSLVYWPKPKIALVPGVETRSTSGGVVMTATLGAHNQEEQEISECTATLETAMHLYGDQMTPVTTIRNARLRWQEDQFSSEDCRITLAPRPASQAIVVGEMTKGFQFSACKPSASDRGLLGLYVIRIRVDGKLRGRELEPHFFDGYLYIGNAANSEMLVMVFEKGDWKKDKRLPKPKLAKK